MQNLIHDPGEIGDDRRDLGDNHPFPGKNTGFAPGMKYQILVMIAYITFEITISKVNGSKATFWEYIPYYILHIAAFYGYSYYLFPAVYRTRKSVWRPFLLLVLPLAAHSFLILCLNALIYTGWNGLLPGPLALNYTNALARCFLIATFGGAFWLARFSIEKVRRERALIIAQQYSRMSPHLMLNALNFVHAEVQDLSGKGGEMIMLLSQYARYLLREVPQDGKVSLEEEIGQLQCLVDICKIRFEVSYDIMDIRVPREQQGMRLPPHVLSTLAENVFKFAELEDTDRPARIRLWTQGNTLYFTIRNRVAEGVSVESHRLGIRSTKSLLEDMNGKEKFRLQITGGRNWFNLDLIIVLC